MNIAFKIRLCVLFSLALPVLLERLIGSRFITEKTAIVSPGQVVLYLLLIGLAQRYMAEIRPFVYPLFLLNLTITYFAAKHNFQDIDYELLAKMGDSPEDEAAPRKYSAWQDYSIVIIYLAIAQLLILLKVYIPPRFFLPKYLVYIQVTVISFFIFWGLRETIHPRAELNPALSYLALSGVILYGQGKITTDRIVELNGKSSGSG